MAVAEKVNLDQVVRASGRTVILEYPDQSPVRIDCVSTIVAELRAASVRDVLREWITEANRRHIDVGQ